MKIPIIMVYQYMAVFRYFSPTSYHLHPLQVENCDSNSRLVVDEDDKIKFRLERVKVLKYSPANHGDQQFFLKLEIIINVLVIHRIQSTRAKATTNNIYQ